MNSKKYTFLPLLIALFSFFTIGSLAQQRQDYAAQWKQVDEWIKKGLTKSALEETVKIYETAKKDNNDPQIIKALLFRITLGRNLEENANVKSMELVEKEIFFAKQPARSILNSLLAEMYWNFLQQNRYNLYNRTQTADFKKDDILTWGIEDLHKKIGELYRTSLKVERILEQTKLDPLDAIIIKGNARYLRPTLFDLLAHRALDYFKNDEQDITKPAYAFEIKDDKAFSPAREFAAHSFLNKDSSSQHYHALLIYQKLLRFHAADLKPDALIDADIERVNFVKQYGVMDKKEKQYVKALENIVAAHPDHPAVAEASFLIALEMYNTTLTEDNKIGDKYTLNNAKDALESIVKKFPNSEGGIHAKNLLTQVLHKELSLVSEKVNVPGQPFRTLVTYKNIAGLSFRIIELTPEFKKLTESTDNNQLWTRLIAQKSIRSWKQVLPLPTDYRSHSTEIKVDALPLGEYALLASVDEDFNMNRNPLSAQYFYISNISYVNSGDEYFVLDRTTGQPQGGAKVQVWNQRYDYSERKYALDKLELLTTDKNGHFQLKANKKNTERNLRLEIIYQKDRLFLSDNQYNYNYDAEEEVYKNQDAYDKGKARIFLFTDRSIYRPGQLIYFKGIGVTQDYKTKKNQLLATKDPIKIFLRDAGAQKVDSISLSLNDFSSLNGKFRLPENRLNGEFQIEVDGFENSEISFSIEEYKRPKFYTEFEKVKGTYKVNENIKVTGFAKAYAGNAIDGANVKYRVTRVARFLYSWMFWRGGYPRSSSVEITQGEVKTGVDGKFNIEFEAIPDLSIDKSTSPVFDYKVEADVTDINGETRSTSAVVPVGYKALDLHITLPDNGSINLDSLSHFFVSTKNLSGEFEPSKVEVKMYKLQTPQRLIRSRYWAQADQFAMNREEFLKYFPHDEYNDENKKETWQKGPLVFELSDSTKLNSKFNIQHSKFQQGWYVVEVTAKDRYGQEVKDVQYFQLYDMKAASLPAPAYLWSTVLQNIVVPGETAKFIAGTSANDLFLIQQTTKNKSVNRQQRLATDESHFVFYPLNNEKKIFAFPVTEEDRGGYGVSQFFVKDNRIYSNAWGIDVPWTNKQLDITFATYRDKTLPGSEEKWKVKISGYKGQKVVAEMLASMYDASLDQFKPHNWSGLNIWPNNYNSASWNGQQNFTSVRSFEKWWNEDYLKQKEKIYDELMFGNFNYGNHRLYKTSRGRSPGTELQESMNAPLAVNEGRRDEHGVKGEPMTKKSDTASKTTVNTNTGELKNGQDLTDVKARKKLNEAAFFFPELRTDKDGNIEFSFTMPEALTQWKLMTLAHTKDLSSGTAIKTVITQKEIMVQPNAPRFVREGDKLEFSAKVVNMGDKPITGQAQLQLLNAATMEAVDGLFKNVLPIQNFSIPAGQSIAVKFNIAIPLNFNNALVYRIVAKASPLSLGEGWGEVSDGEEAAIPVLTNRMLVTETIPLPMRGNTTKHFTFEKLLKSGNSATLTNFSLTTEFTTNPAWYAVQALPYLMEYPYECAEQTFNRFYANSIASEIVNSSPKIKAVFEKWKITDTSALLSNLQKNEELKSVLLQETPWILQAQNESQQKKNIALLFDMVRMGRELESSFNRLKDMQSSNGGFVWFKGGPDDRYMTQYIITGIGHLKKLGALSKSQEEKIKSIVHAAISYLDKRLREDYDYLIKNKVKLSQDNLGSMAIHYLYMRSFFPEYPIAKESQTAYNYYRDQEKKYWLGQGKYMQALIALSLNRTGDNNTAQAITRSLQENSINNEELGMYWKEWDVHSWWWYQAPIESQAMMIEAFSEINKDQKVVDDLKTWLLKNKQTNNWHTTRATAEACYALLLQGSDWLNEEKNVVIKLGSTTISSPTGGAEAGTGYFKTKIEGKDVKPAMGNISVTVSTINPSTNQPINNTSSSWGAVYWQYFEDLDKITFSETPLKLSKKLFIEKNSATGPVLTPVNEGTQLKVGDKIKVRIELRVDRDMEYVHMKDMRASCMEPVNVISQYKYQGGLGYYESTKDASTNFFFNYLNRGTYVFEYPMFVTHSGNFSNGITTIQCMYAPEFTAHSEGVRVNVAR